MKLFLFAAAWFSILVAGSVDSIGSTFACLPNTTDELRVIPLTEYSDFLPVVPGSPRSATSTSGAVRYNGRGEYHVGYDILLSCGIDYAGDNLYGEDGKQIVLSGLGRANCYILCDWFILNCEAATWTSYNGGTCWFKWGIFPILSYFHEGTATQFFTVRDETLSDDRFAVYPWGNCDMQGYDIGSEHRSEYSGCVKACNKVKDCWAWTWTDYNGGTCWLKSQARPCAVKNGAKSGYHWKRVEKAVTASDCRPRVFTLRRRELPEQSHAHL